jgi:predicted negative regulator of RcsB-dependent stress response
MTSKIIKDHYAKLSAAYGYNVIPPHDEINQISRFLRNDPNRIAEAIDLLKMNAGNYPTSSVIQETLGDSFVKAGDTKSAVVSYQKASELDATNKGLQQKIDNLNR